MRDGSIPLLSKEGRPRSGRGGYQGTAERTDCLFEFTNHCYCFALSGSRFAPVCAAKERDLFISGAATPMKKLRQ